MDKLEQLISSLNSRRLKELEEYLKSFLSSNRIQTIERALSERTRTLTIALENVYQSHNASAVVRSCDCFGIQDVHIIESGNSFKINPNIAHGASKWTSLHIYNGDQASQSCFQHLHERGYRLVAMSLRRGSIPLTELELTKPLALCFGSEETGLSEQAYAWADDCVSIPMLGFTQSLNLSVSVGITLYQLRQRLNESGIRWDLDSLSRRQLRTLWFARSTSSGTRLVQKFLNES